MAESYTDKLRRRAIQLVFDKKFTPLQTAKKLDCSPRAVRRWLQDHRETESIADAGPLFLPVEIIENDGTVQEPVADPIPETSIQDKKIPLDILTRNGFTFRFQLPSLHDVTNLLRELESEQC